MIFRQTFEPVSSTYTYLLACETTGKAMLLDPVVNAIERDLEILQMLGLTLAFTLEPTFMPTTPALPQVHRLRGAGQ